MHRRNFIRAMAGGGAGMALLSLEAKDKAPSASASVAWTVKGFTCVTCAVGLQTILERQKGIAKVTAQYPSGSVQVAFDSRAVTPVEIRGLIEKAGFTVQDEAQPARRHS